jgi:hypothetical protein
MIIPEGTSAYVDYIQEPLLGFAHGQKCEHPKDGLYLYGPVHETPRMRVSVGVIGTVDGVKYFKVRWTPFAGQEPGRLKRESRRISHSLPIRGAKHYLSIDPILR